MTGRDGEERSRDLGSPGSPAEEQGQPVAGGARTEAGSRVEKPLPPHPTRRREPLPEYAPKPAHEDPDAPARVRRLVEDPDYAPADEDVSFLKRYDTRGVRLQLDYLKPELRLEKHGIRHAIVVFGSTRIVEPATARRRVEELQSALADDPDSGELGSRLASARRVLDSSRYYHIAREFGRIVGGLESSTGQRMALVTGGGPGIMEAANRGAWEAGGPSVGLNINLPHEQFPNPYITPGLCMSVHYFAIRKLHFLLRARALVAFPGGFGTLDELFGTLTLVQTRKVEPLPIVLVGRSYWRKVVNLDALVEEGTVDPEDRELFWFAETAEEIWDDIRRWYERSGTSLFA